MTPETYTALLDTHRTFVGCSIALFCMRGAGVALGRAWPMARSWRYTSVLMDVLLLASGVALWITMAHDPRSEPWLAAKLLLLPVYVVLGSFALKRGRTPGTRAAFFVAALLVVFTMLSMAITRSALGMWSLVL